MHVLTFLRNITDSAYLDSLSYCVFLGAGTYPYFFFLSLLSSLKKNTIPVVVLDVTTTSDEQLFAQLSTTFLGQRFIYWLGSLEELSLERKKKWYTYVQNYTGPHTLFLYVSAPDPESLGWQTVSTGKKKRMTVSLPDVVDRAAAKRIVSFESDKINAVSAARMIDAVYALHKTITFNQLYVLLLYMQFVGRNYVQFERTWLIQLIGSDTSLFTLSQYFFAKDKKRFFALWASLKDLYNISFWVVFWSDQLFRAGSYVTLMRKKEVTQARKISFKLPFSFLQRQWKQYQFTELQRAHQWVYRLDHAVKNGASDAGVDLFYSKFLQGDFARYSNFN